MFKNDKFGGIDYFKDYDHNSENSEDSCNNENCKDDEDSNKEFSIYELNKGIFHSEQNWTGVDKIGLERIK